MKKIIVVLLAVLLANVSLFSKGNFYAVYVIDNELADMNCVESLFAWQNEMNKIIAEIQSGKFAEEFLNELENGSETFNNLRKENEAHLIEQVGAKIRGVFSWNNDNKIIDRNKN